jgi:mannose-6-phosphate isomerase
MACCSDLLYPLVDSNSGLIQSLFIKKTLKFEGFFCADTSLDYFYFETNLYMSDKQQFLEEQQQYIEQDGFRIQSFDFDRPWGGFFVLDEGQADLFIETYFPTYKKEDLMLGNKLSPKILVVEPGKRLSWQYHHRRAEIWRVVEGEVGVVMSDTDEQTDVNVFEAGDIIVLSTGQRHRLVGLKDWGVIAEIWQHTDPANPSDEDDIVRLQDDFGR